MAMKLVIPEIGESITEVMVAQWLVPEGQLVKQDEPVAELESDKATLEFPAPITGVITKVLIPAGTMAKVGDIIAEMEERTAETVAVAPPASQPAEILVMPAARRALSGKGLRADEVTGTGKNGAVTKADVLAHKTPVVDNPPVAKPAPASSQHGSQEVDIVPMSPMRRTIANRLIESQQTTAQLTTFNEIDLSAVIALRKQYQEQFKSKYGIKLGFMSFFIKASIEALKAYPGVNAEIQGTDIVYKNFFNIGIAVQGGKGLVVPVLHNAEHLSFAETELAVADFGIRARENKIRLDELQGGTFTISNGGVFGSLLSTPILNPPQSGVLGMHAIQERPVVRDGEIVARPMMYVAMTYDHRLVDGRESVGFVVKIKELIEDPERILLEV